MFPNVEHMEKLHIGIPVADFLAHRGEGYCFLKGIMNRIEVVADHVGFQGNGLNLLPAEVAEAEDKDEE